jgi:peptidoglycan-associated lipoprotein
MKSVVAVLALMVVGAGCSRGRTEADVVPPAPSTATPPPATATPPAPDSRAAEEEARRAEAARRRTVLQERVHFEFDRSDITDAARVVLDRKTPIFNSDRSIRVRIDGHADERGSVEYNLALSLRRANAVRAYLVDSGVAASQLEVAAFGEEQPLAPGRNENAWASNRRAEFRIMSGL